MQHTKARVAVPQAVAAGDAVWIGNLKDAQFQLEIALTGLGAMAVVVEATNAADPADPTAWWYALQAATSAPFQTFGTQGPRRWIRARTTVYTPDPDPEVALPTATLRGAGLDVRTEQGGAAC